MVLQAAADLRDAFLADDVVIGGGNAKKFREPPANIRLGNNLAAFRGGYRLWHIEDVKTHDGSDALPKVESRPEWRLL